MRFTVTYETKDSPINFLLVLGTARDSTPPSPSRLGLRVAKACVTWFAADYANHALTLVDPLDYELAPVFKPHFAYARGKGPAPLEALAEKIETADGYIMVSPEYNHSMSPALAHLLNHFGSSLFAYKPSAIVTYSAGQWGGVRAAMAMRAFLSELGCLPVSAMAHVPKAQDVFDEDGTVKNGQSDERWSSYFGRTFSQLVWWATAAEAQRAKSDPHAAIGNFKRDPSQRNVPGTAE